MVSGLQGQEGPYHAGPVIPIGGEGGWDYLSVDPAAHRLYVSHATHVVVIDTQTNKVVGDIPDTPGVHGFIAVPELGKGFSSNGRENNVERRRSEDVEADSEDRHRRESRHDRLRARRRKRSTR